MFTKLSFTNLILSSLLTTAFAAVLILIILNLKSSVKPEANPLLPNHPLVTWGSNMLGQLASDSIAFSDSPVTVLIKDVRPASIAAGRNHNVVLDALGRVWTWGDNQSSQLGRPTKFSYESKPDPIPTLSDVEGVASNQNHILALKKNGTVWAWGSNYSGQLGNGTNQNNLKPVQVKNVDNIKQIAAGYKFSLALQKDGTLWAWGTSCDTSTKTEAQNWWKQFASNIQSLDGGYYDPTGDEFDSFDSREDCINEEIVGIQSKLPKKIEGVSDIKNVSGGYGHVLVLKNNGTVWSFGCNKYGQLGNGGVRNIAINSKPAQIEGLQDVVAISAGFRHSLAVKKDGTVWAWGHNSFGELGNSSYADSATPTRVVELTDIVEAKAGYDYSIALKKDGTVWAWGSNKLGQLGQSDISESAQPIQVKNINEIKEIAAGGAHVLALGEKR